MALALEDSDDEFKRNVDGMAIQKTRSLPAKRLGPLWAGQIYPAYGPKWREREYLTGGFSKGYAKRGGRDD